MRKDIIEPKTPLEAVEQLELFLFATLDNYNIDGNNAMIGLNKQELFDHIKITKNQIIKLTPKNSTTSNNKRE